MFEEITPFLMVAIFNWMAVYSSYRGINAVNNQTYL